MNTLRHTIPRLVYLSQSTLPRYRLDRHLLSTTIPPILLAAVLYTLHHQSPGVLSGIRTKLISKDYDGDCHFDPALSETCRLVHERCSEFDDDGLIPYFHWYYCAPSSARPAVLVGMFAWLLVLFAAMAAVAGDYLSVNLSVIVSTLGISESLAGVKIFAFGNGSSDLFSTLAAMNSSSGGLAITELFGAAAFITTVVLGLVATTQPFTVNPGVFIGEIVWFILLASCLLAFLADGQLQLEECLGIIGLYIAFVLYAVLRPDQFRSGTETAAVTTSCAEIVAQSVVSNSRDTCDSEEPGETTGLLNSNGQPASHDSEQVDRSETARGHPLSDSKGVIPSFGEAIFKMLPAIYTWSTQSAGEKTLTLFSLPLLLPIGLTTPIELTKPDHSCGDTNVLGVTNDTIADTSGGCPVVTLSDPTQLQARGARDRTILPPRVWVLCVQYLFGPQLLAFIFVSQTSIVEATPFHFELAAAWALLLSALLIAFHVAAHRASSPRLATINHFCNATYAFMISLMWIYLAATSIVTLLKTIGFILDIPEAVLGATIFAIGNSSNDLVANPAVARRGFPILAASACFGGPMMNMLLGIGIGGLIQIIKADSHEAYSFDTSAGLLISAANLLLGLSVTLVYAFCNSWRLDKRLALILMGIWTLFTSINIAFGIAG